MQAGKSPRENLGDIANHSARGRRDDADALRKPGNRTLALRIEQTFGRQLLLQLFEGELQRAVALRLNGFHQKLIFAARLVNINMAARENRHAVLRLDFQVAQRLPEAYATQLRVVILEREIAMAARDGFTSRDFSRPPDVVELVAQQAPDTRAEFRDGESFADRLP